MVLSLRVYHHLFMFACARGWRGGRGEGGGGGGVMEGNTIMGENPSPGKPIEQRRL